MKKQEQIKTIELDVIKDKYGYYINSCKRSIKCNFKILKEVFLHTNTVYSEDCPTKILEEAGLETSTQSLNTTNAIKIKNDNEYIYVVNTTISELLKKCECCIAKEFYRENLRELFLPRGLSNREDGQTVSYWQSENSANRIVSVLNQIGTYNSSQNSLRVTSWNFQTTFLNSINFLPGQSLTVYVEFYTDITPPFVGDGTTGFNLFYNSAQTTYLIKSNIGQSSSNRISARTKPGNDEMSAGLIPISQGGPLKVLTTVITKNTFYQMVDGVFYGGEELPDDGIDYNFPLNIERVSGGIGFRGYIKKIAIYEKAHNNAEILQVIQQLALIN